MKKPRLLVVTSTFPRWKDDKISIFALNLPKHLLNYFDITVLAPHYKGAKFFEEMEGLKVYRFVYALPFVEVLTYGGGTVSNIKKNPLLLLLLPFYSLSNILWMIYLLLTQRHSTVHIHWIFPAGFLATLLKPLFRFRLVITSHGGDIFGLSKMKIWKILQLRFFAKVVLSVADAMTTVTSALKEEMIKKTGLKAHDKISIIPMGISFNQFHIKEREYHKLSKESLTRLIFVGRHSLEKAINYQIEAVRILVQRGYSITFTIVGDGPERPTLEKLVKKYGLGKVITFMGYIKNSDIPPLHYEHDIFLHSSLREGLPGVYVEAGATGLPVVVTETEGIRDMITDKENGLLVAQGDSEGIANACAFLIDTPGEYEKISRNSIDKAKEYDWEIISKKYADVLS